MSWDVKRRRFAKQLRDQGVPLSEEQRRELRKLKRKAQREQSSGDGRGYASR
jgi:hypothetical protein